MGTDKNNLVYCYCLTNITPEINEVKNLINDLYFIYHSDLYAVVSKVSEDEFCEENLKKNLCNMEWVKKKVYIHEGVIEGVMKHTSLIPFKFASLFTHEESVRERLQKNAGKFKEKLRYLEGKEEWGVKIYCDRQKLRENIIREDNELLEIDKKISSSKPGSAFFLNKKREELINRLINTNVSEYGQDIFRILEGKSIKTTINKLLPKQITEREDDMILNSAFLVDKDEVNIFVNLVDLLQTQYENMGLFFECTGSWPPYNFC